MKYLPFFAAFLHWPRVPWPTVWHRLCIVRFFKTRLLFGKTGRFQGKRTTKFYFFFLLFCLVFSIFYLRKCRHKMKVVPTTLLTCFAPRWWYQTVIYNRQKHALVTQFLSKLVTFFVVVTVRSNFFYPIFFLSAFYYPHAPSAGIRSASYRHLPELTHGVRSVRTGV